MPRSSGSRFVPPLGLWVLGGGRLDELSRRLVLVAGRSQASPYGTFAAAGIVGGLVAQGWSVMTFGRYGVHAAAARAALAGSPGVLVVPRRGLGRLVPRGHAELLRRVAVGGVLVSEWADAPGDLAVARSTDLAVHLAAAVVLIEPDGARGEGHLVRACRQFGRPLFTVPGPVTAESCEFSHALIRRRRARLVTSAKDMLADLGRCTRAAG